MFSLHHVHLMASDVDATIAFWRDHFGADVLFDGFFAGARNVFPRVGEGRLHLYAQPPRHAGQGTAHHLGIETDDLLLELFQPDPAQGGDRLVKSGYFASVRPKQD